MIHKYLVVGAGFAGATIAERLANDLHVDVLVIDKRNHVAGNAYDDFYHGKALYHKYGPHYFRTNSLDILQYLSSFIEFKNVEYKIKIFDGIYYSFPINLNTFEQITGKTETEASFKEYLSHQAIPIQLPRNSEEVIISKIGRTLFEKFYKNYTYKQWKRFPCDLDPSVCGRIPIRTNRNELYFDDIYQCLPVRYTFLIENMLDHPHIDLLLNTSYKDIKCKFDFVFFTGPIDEFFSYKFGPLPYRSLRFEHKEYDNIGINQFIQPALQINYPNVYDYTRTVELKHITHPHHNHSLVTYEYPEDWDINKIPYYPVPCLESQALLNKYNALTKLLEHRVYFLGRLGKYRYYNMDQVVAQALSVYEHHKRFLSRK